ncbi:uncharacterized protein LOC126907719 isoform X1 [Daktulosphaira vitifoliae]|uniref:uncharacterized protein LOC126907719 isoform X1 n=1 Tax=Daktulosphaira vitifoliae TaxID=58002 RepID=UPI0021A9ED4F|nr:uncharacterized protein LOC126907719 isoform X1 [Daktulosphaira vitifoliae]
MLTHPYWRYGVEFIKMYLNTEPLFLLFDEKVEKIDASILFPDSTTEIVTKYNFQEKVIQYHLLLSCYYGLGLKNYVYYVKELCKLCIKVDPKSCEIQLKKKIIEYTVELIKMKNSLLHFSRWLGDKPKLTNLVHKVIDNLLIISQNTDTLTSDDTLIKLNLLYEMINKFFKKHMEPEIGKNKSTSEIILKKTMQQQNLPLDIKISYILKCFQENINLNSYNNRQCGFIYDKITSDCIGVTKYVECPITPPPQYDKDDDDFYTLKF